MGDVSNGDGGSVNGDVDVDAAFGDSESLEEVRALDKLVGTSRVRATVKFVRFCVDL